MAYTQTVTVKISLSDIQVTTEGFGTPNFFTAHRAHPARIAAYSNSTDVGIAYGTASPAFEAAKAVFAQQPSVSTFKIGRRSAQLSILPVNVTDSDVFALTITNKLGVEAVHSYTVQTNETESDVVAAFVTSINGHSDSSKDVTASANGNRLVLSDKDSSSWFTVGTFSGTNGDDWQDTADSDWIGIESAADMYASAVAEDSDFYFVTCDDNADAFVKSMASVIEAVDKLYFFSDSNILNIQVPASTDLALMGVLAAGNFDHTIGIFHQDAGDSAIANDHADSNGYVELGFVGANAPKKAGSANWSNVTLQTFAASQNPTTGDVLGITEKGYLEARNGNYLETDGTNVFMRHGKALGGEWIDVIRGVHWQTVDVHTSLKTLLLSGRVIYDESGFAQVRGAIRDSLDRGIDRGFILAHTITLPDFNAVTGAVRNTRILDNATFSMQLAHSINDIVATGTATSNSL